MTTRFVTEKDENNHTTVYTEVDGKIEGEKKTFYESGELYSLHHYIGGVMNGPFVLYQENGLPMVIGNFLNGQWHGEFNYYNIKGELTNTVNF